MVPPPRLGGIIRFAGLVIGFQHGGQCTERVHRRFDGGDARGTPLMPSIAADGDQRRIHDRRDTRTNVFAGRAQAHRGSRDRPFLQCGQFDQREQSLHERFVLQRPGHAGIAYRHAVGAQSFAEGAHGGVVMRDQRDVVPLAAIAQMLGFDLPHHVVEFFGRRTVQRGLHAAVVGQPVRFRQSSERPCARDLRHFPRPVRQRLVGLFDAGDGKADARGEQRAVVDRPHGVRFEAFQPRPHACFRRFEQVFRI